MSDLMRKMIDELMGTNRNGSTCKDALTFTSSNVCRSYLLGLCPHDLFSHMGTFKVNKKICRCYRIHDPALKADYEQVSVDRDYNYEIEQLQHIRDFIKECDEKVSRNKMRLSKVHIQQRYGPESETVAVLQSLSDQISINLTQAEESGSVGNVDECRHTLNYVEELKADKRRAVENYRNYVSSSRNQQQKLRVCEVCGAYLSLYDNDRRLADHFRGKLHMGFVKLRDFLRELEGRNLKNEKEYARCRFVGEITGVTSQEHEIKDSTESVESSTERNQDRKRNRSLDREFFETEDANSSIYFEEGKSRRNKERRDTSTSDEDYKSSDGQHSPSYDQNPENKKRKRRKTQKRRNNRKFSSDF